MANGLCPPKKAFGAHSYPQGSPAEDGRGRWDEKQLQAEGARPSGHRHRVGTSKGIPFLGT